jgi:DNA-binding NtrC family response regulator
MWPLHHHLERGNVKIASAAPALLAILSDAFDQEKVKDFTACNHWCLNVVSALESAAASVAADMPPVILLDRDLAGQDWRDTVRMLASHRPAPAVILASHVLDQYLFTEVVHHGGYDVISKPLQVDELRRILGLAFSFWKNQGTKAFS